nr:retrovirus-related Pol polyprotein from transposon TNT 1-94 [Tanacetum cinerariifolium]
MLGSYMSVLARHAVGDLEVAFRKSTCFIRDLKGNDLLTGSRGTDLYSITLQESKSTNPICLMAKASSSQAWLWHRRLSHLNFDTINLLLKNDIVVGLPKLKFIKDHLCSSCELRKAKRKSFHSKLTPSSKRRLHLLHMDLCGPMRVASINGKRYVLVIMDDYSRYTWTHFLRPLHATVKQEVESKGFDELAPAESPEGSSEVMVHEKQHYHSSSVAGGGVIIGDSQVSDKSKAGLGYKATSSAVGSSVNSSAMLENQENVESRLDKGYHAVPPPFTWNYMPPKRDLRLIDEHVESVSVDVISNIAPSDVKTVESKHKMVDVNHKGLFSTEEPKHVMKNSFSPPIIEDWHSDDESEVEISPIIDVKIVKPSIENIKFVKTARKHFGHLPYDCDQRVVKPLWNNTRRVNHKNFDNKFTHPHPKRRFVSQAVLTRSGKINTACASVTTAVRPVNTAGSKSSLNHPKLISNAFKRGHSQVIRPFNKYSAYKKTILNKEIKTAQAKKIADLKRRVKKLERKKLSFKKKEVGKKEKGRNLKQRSIFEESIFDVQAMMDADYELAARLKAEEQKRKPLTKAQKKNQI